jgi:hypothetical protein
MTTSQITALVPPATLTGRTSGPESTGRRNPLPVSELVSLTRHADLRYGLGCIDPSGRVAAKPLLADLGWAAGQTLTITALRSALVVHPDAAGVFAIADPKHLVLPARVRRRCGLSRHDQVLLAADPAHQVLVVHPASALDAMISQYHASLLGGDPR